jgi:galactokinase
MSATIAEASATGRLDFMGGVADYSGSLVLEMPIRARTTVRARVLDEDVLRVHSAGDPTGQRYDEVVIGFAPLRAALASGAGDEQLRALLDAVAAPGWTRYCIGSALVFCADTGWLPPGGLAFAIESKVPQGMGVSSSAALEVATLRAVSALAGLRLNGARLARLGQRAENRIVGAPCGLMDQLTAAFGRPHHLLPILCRPDVLRAPLRLPDDLLVVGWLSGVKHDVGGSPYATARTAAFMGKKIIETRLGRRWQHVAEIAPSLFRSQAESALPETMTGGEFVERFGATDDPLSRIEPHRHYPVRAAMQFPIEENFRCALAETLLRGLENAHRATVLRQVGELMMQSHAGYGAMGLGSPETDRMARAAMEAGAGIYGARVSGGGSGGAVVVLLEKNALPALEELRRNLFFCPTGPLELITA